MLVINNMQQNIFCACAIMVLLREFKYTFNARVLNIWSSLPCLQQPAIRSYTELLLSTQFISDFEANISAKCQSGETCVCVCTEETAQNDR